MVQCVPLPPMMRTALETLRQLGRPGAFDEFALIPLRTPRRNTTYNVFRQLKQAGYIEDVTKPYAAGEPYTGPRMSSYRLTPLGIRALISGQRERA